MLLSRLPPLQLLIYGYLALLMLGFMLLQLPFAQANSTDSLDNLFIATSALSTTGLATIDVAQSYTFFGELVILLLIQIGGIGYMSLGSFFVLSTKHRLSRVNTELLATDFSLPEKFSIVAFVKNLVLFTILIEVVGAISLTLIFWQVGESAALWKGVFHSISAFCTAGFSLFPSGFVPFQSNFWLNLVVSVLSISGAIGFIVFTDLLDSATGRKTKITYTSKIILRFTFLGILLGAAVIYLSDTAIGAMAPENGLLIAFFQSMTAFTTVGFNTYDIASIAPAPLFFMILLMIIGASPSGTGGGMKSTTITALYAQLKSTFRGDQRAIFMNRIIPANRIAMATSNFFFYILTVCFGTYLLLLVQQENTFDVLFEAISALGTVGVSTGLTGSLTVMGKLIIVAMMFLGRVGPLSFGIAVFSDKPTAFNNETEDIAI